MLRRWSSGAIKVYLTNWRHGKASDARARYNFAHVLKVCATSDFQLPSLLASVCMSALALSCEIHKTGAFHIFGMTRKGDGELRKICSEISFLSLGYHQVPLVGSPIPANTRNLDAKASVV